MEDKKFTKKRPEIFDRVERGNGLLLKAFNTNPKAPDLEGIIKFADDMQFAPGDELKIKGWTRKTGTGNMLISLVIDNWKPDPNYKRAYQPKPDRELNDEDSDIPF